MPVLARDAATVSSVSPSSIHAFSGEWFVQINGTKFLPATGVEVIFTGTRGTFSLTPNKLTDSRIDVWVPSSMILGGGTYSVKVRVPDGADSNAATFKVIGSTVNLQIPQYVLAEALAFNGAPVKFDVIATSYLGEETYVDCSHRSGDTFPFDITSVDCTASDNYGGSDRQSFKIEVVDTTAPAMELPDGQLAFGKPEGAYVEYKVTAKDVVDGESPIDCAPKSGSFFPLGTSTVNCTSSDRRENVEKKSFRIHVGDEETPALVLPRSVVAEAQSREGSVVEFEAKATDSKGNPATEVRCDPKPGSLFPMGVTSVKCTAWGPSGKSITDVFDVQVADTAAPVLSLPRDVSVQASRPEGEYVSFDAKADDAVDGGTSVSCYPKSGSFFAPGTTTVTCSASDSNRNESTSTFEVDVQPWVDETEYLKSDDGTMPQQ
jgi:hypothetical protein